MWVCVCVFTNDIGRVDESIRTIGAATLIGPHRTSQICAAVDRLWGEGGGGFDSFDQRLFCSSFIVTYHFACILCIWKWWWICHWRKCKMIIIIIECLGMMLHCSQSSASNWCWCVSGEVKLSCSCYFFRLFPTWSFFYNYSLVFNLHFVMFIMLLAVIFDEVSISTSNNVDMV